MKIESHGATLEINVLRENLDGIIEFSFGYSDTAFSGWVVVSDHDYAVGSMAVFFRGLASGWGGWIGEQVWEELHSDSLKLSATHDGKGLVTLRAHLQSHIPSRRQLSVSFLLDAGQLQSVADRVTRLLNA